MSRFFYLDVWNESIVILPLVSFHEQIRVTIFLLVIPFVVGKNIIKCSLALINIIVYTNTLQNVIMVD